MSQSGRVPTSDPTPPSPATGGVAGLFADPSTLAATGLLAAVLFAIVGGLVGVFGDVGTGPELQTRLLLLTQTVDVGDVALLGIAVALLLLTPDPPGGFSRPTLLRVDAVLAAVIAVYGVIRALVLLSNDVDVLSRLSGFVATVGVALAAATVAFYAAKESFLKEKGRI